MTKQEAQKRVIEFLEMTKGAVMAMTTENLKEDFCEQYINVLKSLSEEISEGETSEPTPEEPTPEEPTSEPTPEEPAQ